MKILIIGINGFIGSHASSYFKYHGHDVKGVAARGLPNSNLFLVDKFNPDFDPIFKENEFDVCINASGSSGVGFSIKEPEKDYQLNVGIVKAALSSIKRHAPSCKFVHLSSAAVYGNPERLPIQESDPVNPISPYGHHKVQAEDICNEYYKEYGVGTVSLRIFSVYGPGLRKQLFWDIYQKSIIQSELELFGTGQETRDYIYIDDLLNAIEIVIAKAEFKHEVINVANGEETTIKQASTTLMQYLDENKKISFNGNVRKGDPLNWRADISKLKTLGYEPNVEMKTGLRKFAEWTGKI